MQSDFPAKPLPPTSMGKHWARHPCLRHSSTSSEYFAFSLSLASYILPSQSAVSSGKTTCLDVSGRRTMSGLKLVSTMFTKNSSCFPRSTLSCQYSAVPRRPVQASSRTRGCSVYRRFCTLVVVSACSVDNSADGLSYWLWHLNMVPKIAAISKRYRATAGDVFKSYSLNIV